MTEIVVAQLAYVVTKALTVVASPESGTAFLQLLLVGAAAGGFLTEGVKGLIGLARGQVGRERARVKSEKDRIAELERGESKADRRADCEAGNRREIDEWASNLVRLLNESGIPFPPRPHLRNCNIDREET